MENSLETRACIDARLARLRAVAVISTLGLAALPLALGCDDTVAGAEQDARELKSSAAERIEETGRAVDVQLVEFKRDANDGLARIDAKFAQIEKKLAQAGDDVKAETASQLEALKRQREELAKKVQEASDDADSQWEATKRSLDESIAELGKDTDRILDELGDDVREATE